MDSKDVPTRGAEAEEKDKITQTDIDEIVVLEVISPLFADAIQKLDSAGILSQAYFEFRVKDGSLFECRLRRLG